MVKIPVYNPFKGSWSEEWLDLPVEKKGLVATYPFVDLHVHVRLGGVEGYDTLEKAVIAGGFGMVVIQPNTKPDMVNVQILKNHERESSFRMVKFLFTASLFGRLEIGGRVVAYSTDGIRYDYAMLKRAFSNKVPGLLMDHSQIYEMGGHFYRGTKAPLATRPRENESLAMRRTVLTGLRYGWRRFHIQHLTTKLSVETLAQLKKIALVTGEVTPHHLLLTMEDIDGPDRKVNPPFGREEDRRALIEGVKKGIVDALASDHAPHFPKPADLKAAPFGSSTIEVAFSAYYTAIGELELVLQKMTVVPLRILGFEGDFNGENIVVIDPKQEFVVDSKRFFSGGKNCALNGMKLKGKVVGLKLSGRWIYWDGEFLFDQEECYAAFE